MTSTRLATFVFVVMVTTGLTLLALAENPWLSIGGALLVSFGSASLIRHFWRQSDARAKRERNAHLSSIREMFEAGTARHSDMVVSGLEDISARTDALSRGVLEHVAQLGIELESVRDNVNQQGEDRRRETERADKQSARHRDEILSQISGIIGVYAALQPAIPYPPFGGWAIAGDCARRLVTLILGDKRSRVLEAGSGLSTVIVAQALELVGGDGRLMSLEHDAEWLDYTRTLLEEHRIGHRVELIHAPLVDTEIGGSVYKWYDISRAELPDQIDLVFIDGPPKATGTLARYPALPMIYERISPGGVLLMDDASRPDEREAIERWKLEFPRIGVHYHLDTKGTVEITKPDS